VVEGLAMLKDIAPKPASGAVARARKLRKEMTLPEVLLWRLLRGQPQGVKFRRQHPSSRIGMDFYCSDARLVIEVDGIAHDMGDNPERDLNRDAWLRSKGIDTVRIPATDVLKDANAVADGILALALSRLPIQHPAITQDAPPSRLCRATSPRRARGGI
jgi:very-short-patch-repair endonuclease